MKHTEYKDVWEARVCKGNPEDYCPVCARGGISWHVLSRLGWNQCRRVARAALVLWRDWRNVVLVALDALWLIGIMILLKLIA